MSYDDTETSQSQGSPVELYEFAYGANYLRYTSAAKSQIYQGFIYTPYAMKRGEIGAQAASVEQQLEVTAYRDFPVAQLFRVQAPSTIVNLILRRKHLLDVGNEFTVFWMGRVLNAAWQDNSEVVLQCESDLSSLQRIVLRRMYQLNCSWVLYGQGCGVSAALHAVPVSAFSAVGRVATIGALAGYEDNFFAGGYLEYQNALLNITEYITIRSSAAGVLQLALIPYGLDTATTAKVYPGCNHTTEQCLSKYANLDNFGGQPYIPGQNPFAGITLF